jgi:hypothetical protein
MNDFWRFDVTTNGWAMLTGGKTIMNPAIGISNPVITKEYYVLDPKFTPGANRDGVLLQDYDSSKLYLFGGSGLLFDAESEGYSNAIWAYDIVLGYWGYVYGTNTLGVAKEGYVPPGTVGALAFFDKTRISGAITVMYGEAVRYSGSVLSYVLPLTQWRFDNIAPGQVFFTTSVTQTHSQTVTQTVTLQPNGFFSALNGATRFNFSRVLYFAVFIISVLSLI